MSDVDIFDFHFHYFGKTSVASIERIAAVLDEGQVSGILCCTDLNAPHEEFVERNAPLLELARARGRSVLPLLAMVHLNQPRWQEQAGRWFDGCPELVGVKLHPPVSGYRIEPELVDPLFDFAGERDLLVASHTVPLPGLSAAAFHPSLRRRKQTKLVIYHGSTHEESAYLATSFPNVHVEPSWLGFFPNLFQLMSKLGGYGKLLAGTDGPGWFDGFEGSPYEDLLALARKYLPDEETVAGFVGGNARRLLRIERD